MAKRRKLEAPSAAELSAMEAEIDAQTPARGSAPIAQVAAEASLMAPLSAPQDVTDAAELRQARGEGRLILDIPLEQIDASALERDRIVLNEEAMKELRESIQSHGVRLPIEVYALEAARDGRRYGLISGFRRHLAVSELYELTGIDDYAKIRALVVPSDGAGDALARMVEENEVRADLSPYERGRIAVLAVQQRAFPNVHAAVDGLFSVASKAKRSKIRSFALVFEELGDMLICADEMSERQGLRLAGALREGGEGALRHAMSDIRSAMGFAEVWAVLEPTVAEIEGKSAVSEKPSRGGRPKARKSQDTSDAVQLSSGFILTRETQGTDQVIRISGRAADRTVGESALLAIKHLLDAP